ncbi:MAG TPA: response regulator [Gammaproteobacteria bacterium]|nr:response regulator [Gammaproteobacteria bacterium]
MHIPALYHPTQILLLDDDAEFINSLSLSLADQFKCRLFTSPELAQQFLLDNHHWQQALRAKYVQMNEEEFSQFSVNIEIFNIHLEMFNPKRFERAGILVVDYDMPSMNGLEVARILRSKLPIKIILLTGEADQNTAVEAFNQREIDRFLLKSHPDYHTQLVRYINELQQDYFAEISAAVLEPLIVQENHPLQDNHYRELFENLKIKHQIIEYYLLDDSGSFLMLNTNAEPTWLIARTPADMALFYDMAAIERKIPKKILASLANKTKLICLPPDSRVVPPFSDWFIQDATSLSDGKIYYCVIVGWYGHNSLSQPITSYHTFLGGT